MEELTIAIPFFRGRAYLREAIESVRAQDAAHWRLLVCDDRGEDDPEATAALVASFDDPRLRYERNEANLGMVSCWNRCLELTEGDRVAILHADDRLLPGYVTLMSALLDRHPEAAAAYCGARIIGPDGAAAFSLADAAKGLFRPRRRPQGVAVLAGEEAVAALMAGNFIMCPTLCFRRSRLGERRFDPAWRQVQDLALTVRLLMEGETLVGADEVAYAYRRHPESATTIQSESLLRFEEEHRLFEEVAERAAARGWSRAARVAGRKRIIRLHLLYRAGADLLRGAPGRAAAKLRMLTR